MRQCAEPLVEGLLGVDDNFQLPVLQSAHESGGFRRKGDLDPFPIEPERIGDFKNATDVLKRNHLEWHHVSRVSSRTLYVSFKVGVNGRGD